MANTIETAIIKSVAKILKTTDKNLIKKDDFQKFKLWDSLIHLEILSLLEEQMCNKVNKINTITVPVLFAKRSFNSKALLGIKKWNNSNEFLINI